MSENSVGSGREPFAVTPSDTVNFTQGIVRGLYVGSGGAVVVVTETGGNAITFAGVPTGTILPVRCIRVNSTSTTATSIVGLL